MLLVRLSALAPSTREGSPLGTLVLNEWTASFLPLKSGSEPCRFNSRSQQSCTESPQAGVQTVIPGPAGGLGSPYSQPCFSESWWRLSQDKDRSAVQLRQQVVPCGWRHCPHDCPLGPSHKTLLTTSCALGDSCKTIVPFEPCRSLPGNGRLFGVMMQSEKDGVRTRKNFPHPRRTEGLLK